MRLTKSIKLETWFFIVFNLMMAFGSIWIFMRMAPAIGIIIEQNERSLEACEEMLSILALVNPSAKNASQLEFKFLKSLNHANSNITEKEEKITVDIIRKNYRGVFSDNFESKKKTVSAILQLAEINRNAMVVADRKAKRLGYSGAWGIVFMASAIFTYGMLFMRGLKRNLIEPLEEINSVIQAVKTGNHMRRCTGINTPQNIRSIFRGINGILDQNISNILNDKKWKD